MRSTSLTHKLEWVRATVRFFGKHFIVVMLLGLIAALGRVMQLGGFSHVSFWQKGVLEIFVALARISLFLYVLGAASTRKGIYRARTFFVDSEKRNDYLQTALKNFKVQWPIILLKYCCLRNHCLNDKLHDISVDISFQSLHHTKESPRSRARRF
jgi:hypothetical protein